MVTIRALKRRDRRTIAAMIKKLADKLGDQGILNLMVSDTSAAPVVGEKAEDRQQFAKIGINLVKMMIETMETDVAEWFADLLNVTVEQFDELPFDVELQIIDQLMKAEESDRFFTTALRLSKEIRTYASKLTGQKTA